ncbi:MAG: peptidase M52 [Anaerolineae bacterium]|nr:hydrogenase maturation protease [Anaerolineales bacterium]MCQ3978730.1 peptidase M52 [Anaerolineae bacterium]
MDTLIIGCGNLLRGDDAVGPILVRVLAERGVPPGVRLADGGTAGMDVAFKMRGAGHVIIVDACRTGQPPGTLYQVPGEELAQLPPITGLNLHAFRWDHALAFGRWLLKEEYPSRITVYLIEAENLEFGDELSRPVRVAMENLVQRLTAELELMAAGGN